MSFPRNTDVSKHLARKPRQSPTEPAKSAPAADSAKAELKSLTQDLSAAVDGAQDPPALGRD